MARRVFTEALSALADERDGIVTRRRMFQAGLHRQDIQDGLQRGLLLPVFPGTYTVGRRQLTQRMLVQAATLHFAPAMVLGRSAAEHRELLKLRDGAVTVGTSRRRRIGTLRTQLPMRSTGRPGVVTFRPTGSVEIDRVDGLLLAPVPRMLFDIAAFERGGLLERVWKQADYRGLLDLDELHAALLSTRRAGRPAVEAKFRKHPGRFGVQAHFESAAEVDFLQLIVDAGLPVPQVNVPLLLAGRPYVGDYYWEELGLVAELDDPSHDRPLAEHSDALRDADFFDADIDVIRFKTRAVAADPAANMRRLGAAIERHRRRVAALRLNGR